MAFAFAPLGAGAKLSPKIGTQTEIRQKTAGLDASVDTSRKEGVLFAGRDHIAGGLKKQSKRERDVNRPQGAPRFRHRIAAVSRGVTRSVRNRRSQRME